MSKVYLVNKKEMGMKEGLRTRYTFKNTNNLGEKIIVELSRCGENSHSLLDIWKGKGYIDKDLENYICIEVVAIDKNEIERAKYNPQVKNGKIVFEWVLEDTKYNRQKILSKIARLAKIETGDI